MNNEVFMITIHPLAGYIGSVLTGILVLIFPQILNYIVALYLIIMGVLGILSRM